MPVDCALKNVGNESAPVPAPMDRGFHNGQNRSRRGTNRGRQSRTIPVLAFDGISAEVCSYNRSGGPPGYTGLEVQTGLARLGLV